MLLGILAMGFIFDRFGTKSDAEQLQKLLVRNVRMLAQLAVCPVIRDRAIAVSQISRLRSQINDNFASLESQTDAARFEFEFRHRREQDVAECERIQRAQPALRSIYLLELSLLSHRGRREIDSELTQQQNQALDHFLNEFSDELMHIAAWIAHARGTHLRASAMIPSGYYSKPSRTTARRTRRLSLISVRRWSPLSFCCGTSANSVPLDRLRAKIFPATKEIGPASRINRQAWPGVSNLASLDSFSQQPAVQFAALLAADRSPRRK